jgi:hypothetical protein
VGTPAADSADRARDDDRRAAEQHQVEGVAGAQELIVQEVDGRDVQGDRDGDREHGPAGAEHAGVFDLQRGDVQSGADRDQGAEQRDVAVGPTEQAIPGAAAGSARTGG